MRARAEIYVVERIVPHVLEGVVHDPVRDSERRARSVPVAVEDSRKHPGSPQAAGCVLAALLAWFRLQVYVVCHLPIS
jgi:hypothetical protein